MRTATWNRPLSILFAALLSLSALGSSATIAASPSTGVVPGGPATLHSAINPRSAELVSRRTATSRTYLDHGQYRTVIYPGSINYLDPVNGYQPIDNTLVPSADRSFAYQNKANRYTVSLPPSLSSGPVKVSLASGWVAFSLIGAPTTTGSVSANTDTFSLPGGSISYAAGNDELKESITLASVASPSVFIYALSLSPGLLARQQGNDIAILSGNSVVFSLVAPVMWDSSHSAAGISHNVSLLLSGNPGSQRVTLVPDHAWLSSPLRRYPVTIDPTVTFSGTGGQYQDCFLDADNVTTSFCGSSTLLAGFDGTAPTRTLLKFDLSSLPIDGIIDNAELGMYLSSESTTNATPITVSPLTSSWTTAATWNTYDGTHSWSSPGGDYSSTDQVSNPSVGGSTGWYHWYPTQLVQALTNQSLPNRGFMIKEPTENITNTLSFDSAESASSTYWPYLTVKWDTMTGNLPWYPLYSLGLSDRMDAAVNIATGNLIVHATDFSMPGIDLPLSDERYYNNKSYYGYTDGNSWDRTLGNEIGLYLFNDGSAEFFSPNGAPFPFIKQSDGSFLSPAGIDATLVHNQDGTYSLTFHQSGEVLTMNSSGYLTKITDRSGNSISIAFDGNSDVSSVTDTQGRATTYGYNSNLQLTSITDPAGRLYQYGYDSSGNLTSYTDPNGKITQYHYNPGYGIDKITDPDGNVTEFAYDSSARVTSITRVTANNSPCPSPGCVTTFTYNPTVGSTTVADSNNHSTTYVYDALRRPTSITDPSGHTTTIAWTADDHVSRRVLPSGATESLNYDALNNLTQVVLPTGAVTSSQYGNSALPYNVTSTTDPQGNASTFTYTSSGLLASVKDATGHSTDYSYNANGTLASQTDPNGHITSYGYSNGLLSSVAPPNPLGSISYTYNTTNAVVTKLDGMGQKTTYSYDSIGRVTNTAYADGSIVSYAYDADGNKTTLTDSTGTTRYTYDGLNQETNETLPNGHVISYAWDGTGSLVSKQDSGGKVTYGYTVDEQLASVTDPDGTAIAFTYDQNGNRTGLSFPNGVTETVSHNADGAVTQMTAKNGGSSTLTSFVYSYVNPGNSKPTGLRYNMTDVAGNVWSYMYDGLNRLTQAVENSGGGSRLATYTYAYDSASNMTSESRNGTSTSMTYNSANELTQAGSTTYSYDGNGSRTGTSTGAQLVYNAQNQTTSMVPSGGSSIAMGYTGQGQARRVTAGTTSFQNDNTGVSTVNANGSVSYITRTPDGELLDERTASGTYYYLLDVNGSVAAMTNSSGAIVNSYNYDPYGNATAASEQIQNVFRFDGAQYDSATGLYKNGARYYDPAVGRFTQADPLACPRTRNAFWFADDNPGNLTDPSGLATPCEILGDVLELADSGLGCFYACVLVDATVIGGVTCNVACSIAIGAYFLFGYQDPCNNSLTNAYGYGGGYDGYGSFGGYGGGGGGGGGWLYLL